MANEPVKHSGPTPQGASLEDTWTARPLLSRAIRVLAFTTPILFGIGAALAANKFLAIATTIPFALARSIGIVALSSVVVWGTDRIARRTLPLATLMQLSLVFPDQAPSRFKSALRNGSSRRLEKTLNDTRANGLSADPAIAARQVIGLIGSIGDHDRRTRGHSERVRLFADLVGEELNLSKRERQQLQWGALLHDLGKLMVPPEILNKKGKPSEEEWKILSSHPAEGMELITPLRPFLGEWVHAIGGHHEKWDGSGYPQGLAGNTIPRAAAIVAVADSFEVMTAVRSYKKAMPISDARAELTRCAGSHFSPEIVRAFLNISLGQLRIVTGPFAALAHLPFIGTITQLPNTAVAAVSAPTLGTAAAMPAIALVTAAALAVGGPTFPEAADASQETSVGSLQQVRPTDVATRGEATGKGSASLSNGIPQAEVANAQEERGDGSTTTTLTGSTPATPTSSTPGSLTPPTSAVAPPTTRVPITTTSLLPVTVPTTIPIPTTTTTTTAPVAPAFAIMVSSTALHLSKYPLNGATVNANANVYVFAEINASSVNWSYPGGSFNATLYPFNMKGNSALVVPIAFKMPSAPGSYSVTATSTGNTAGTVTANFTVI